VVAIGPAFKNSFGYIKYAKDDTSRFRLSPDGHSRNPHRQDRHHRAELDAKSSPKGQLEVDHSPRCRSDASMCIKAEQTDKDMILSGRAFGSLAGLDQQGLSGEGQRPSRWRSGRRMLKNADADANGGHEEHAIGRDSGKRPMTASRQ
jgi:hypothetical protein